MLRVLADPRAGGRMGDEASLIALAAWRATRSPAQDPENRKHRVFRVQNLFDGSRETLSFDMLETRARADKVFAPNPGQTDRATALAKALDLKDAVRLDGSAREILAGGPLPLAPLDDEAILVRCARYTDRNEEAEARLALFGMLERPERNTAAFRLLALGAADDDRPLVVLNQHEREDETLARGVETVLAVAGKALVPAPFVESRYPAIRTAMSLKLADAEMLGRICAEPRVVDALDDLDVGAREALIAWLGDAGRNAPLHRGRDRTLRYADALVRERPGGRRVPRALRETVSLLQPARNADAARVQDRLVPEWDAAREAAAFLDLPEPASHASAILSAIAAIGTAVPEAIMDAAWLPRPGGDPISPRDVLTLPSDVVAAARAVLDDRDAPFALQDELDPGLATLPGWTALAARLPDEATSREGLLMRIEAARPPALMGEGALGEALCKAAKAGLTDDNPTTALLCALLRMDGEAAEVVSVFDPLTDDAAMRSRLLALGILCTESKDGAFRSLLHAAFVAVVAGVMDERTLRARLAGTVALSQAGTLEPVEALTRIDVEAMSRQRLDEVWAEAFAAPPGPLPGTAQDDGRSRDGHDALLHALKPFYDVDPVKALRLYVLFTARDPRDTAAREGFGCTDAELGKARAAIDAAVMEAAGRRAAYYLDREIVVAVQEEAEGGTVAPGLTSEPFVATLCDAPGLWIKTTMNCAVCHVTLRRIAFPEFEAVAEMLYRCAWKMLRVTYDAHDRKESVHGLPPTVADAVLALFEGKTASDQAGIVEAIRYIESNIETRIDQLSLPRDSRVRQAQLDFRKALDRGDTGAKGAYRDALLDDDVALDELREAICDAIRGLGYDARGDTTVFELYQNARDALSQAAAPASRTVRVSLADGCLSLLHHGRPINGHEGDPEHARKCGWDRDLINMLSLSQSEKRTGDIGRFGLGFKCVHMLSVAPRIASGNAVAVHIRGGFLPEPWPEGRQHLLAADMRGATLIELPLAPGDEDRGRKAFETFRDNVPGLLLFAGGAGGAADAPPVIDRIECRRGEQVDHWSATALPVTDRIDRVTIAGTKGEQTWLTVRCRGGGVLALPLDGGIPSKGRRDRYADFWHLAPLSGLSETAAWMLDAPFLVDAGRMNMQGSEKDRTVRVREVTEGLGEALIALYDAGPEALGPHVDPGRFWAALSALFVDDFGADATLRSALHRQGAGWSALATSRAVLPDITGQPRRIDPKRHRRLSEELVDRAQAIVALSRGEGVFGSNLTSAAAEGLGIASLSAKALLEEEIDTNPMVTPDRADALYDVLHHLPGLRDIWCRSRFRDATGAFRPPEVLNADADAGPEALDPCYSFKGRAIVRMVQADRGRETASVPPPPAMDGPTPSEVLERIGVWWRDNRATQLDAYTRAVYPDRFDFGALDTRTVADEALCDRTWFTFLALAIFQTLPYNRDRTNLSFLEEKDVARHWEAVSGASGHTLADFAPWHAMLNDWFDKDKHVITFGTWRRSLPDLYMVRRYLDDYRQLFFSLPEAGETGMGLDAALAPAASAMAQRFDANAPPLARALGNGGPWMIRELIRHRLYDPAEAERLSPWCWASRARMVRFYERLHCTPGDGTPGQRSRTLYQALLRHADAALLRFEGDYDLPIDILTRPEHRFTLEVLLEARS